MRGQGRIFQRGPVWWIAYSHHGHEFRESSRSAKRQDALELLTQRLGQRDQGHAPASTVAKVPMSTLIEALLTDMEVRNVASLDSIRSHLKPVQQFFNHRRAADVNEVVIDQFVQQRLKTGLAPGTVNRETALLVQALRLGYRRQQVTRLPSMRWLTLHNVRQGFFERHELETLLPHLPPYLQDVTLFAYYTGWRKREILGLEWRDVDLRTQQIRLRVEQSKNRKGRLLVLHGALLALIEARWQARIVGDRLVPYVFHRRGQRMRDIQTAWENARRHANLSHKLFHDLRRTAVRNMLRAGVPDRVAMEISGHKTRSMLDRYNIINDADIREAMAKVAAAETSNVVRLSSRK